MREWLNLFKKECRAIRNLFLITLAVLIGGGLFLLYQSQGYRHGLIIAPVSLLVIFAFFIPAIYMFGSITRELKQTPHLWLHCPQPAWMLLSAKLVTAIVFMLAVLLVDAVFIYLALYTQYIPSMGELPIDKVAWFIAEAGTYAAIALLGISVYIASWWTLIAVATTAVRNQLGRLRGLVGVGIFILGTWGMGNVMHSGAFQTITQWGPFTIRLRSLEGLAQIDHLAVPEVYFGQILAVIFITLGLFALSSWIIDNKVEV